ncbi:MAG: TolC family protein [Campylobacterota bacterium]|nr:TolC family protein [Campylobacterota bacterium]
MKVSPALLALSLLCSFSLASDENLSLESYISTLKQRTFELDQTKVTAESLKFRDSWISPVQLSYSYLKSAPYDNEQTSMNAAISIDQPIFKFGGIYFGIKYAEYSYDANSLTIDQQKRSLIKQAVSLLMQIKRTELQIERQNYQIDNSRINLEQKREQYINGQLDSGFLNNAIIEKNIVTQALYDLETAKERLVSNFQSISDSDYQTVAIPHLGYLEEAAFLERNIDLKVRRSSIERDYYQKNMIMAKYFPTISLNGSYKWDRSENFQFGNTGAGYSGETKYYSYGLRASMPLDINTFRDIESARADYLKSKVLLDDSKRELQALFEKVSQNLNNVDKKIALASENRELYEVLVHDTEVLYQSGYKTEYDLQNMKNSLEIEKINIETYYYDKQLELLELYEKVSSEV